FDPRKLTPGSDVFGFEARKSQSAAQERSDQRKTTPDPSRVRRQTPELSADLQSELGASDRDERVVGRDGAAGGPKPRGPNPEGSAVHGPGHIAGADIYTGSAAYDQRQM